ncbi:A disintegrin and metalloproteinase with thrombospondin motifs 12-like [Clarias magur]|uniref:A disintegrin and metalloproteinase with thrombospondin motifs 12-like n=1 Tax=Clarias magur TaxID=1594786 RepID=A0A8J4WS95_CLAMG|nr:A disintegrin and metalloproteinase with thrombospondin motifs 12-like [Clarias magur]
MNTPSDPTATSLSFILRKWTETVDSSLTRSRISSQAGGVAGVRWTHTGVLSLPSGVFLIEPVRGHTPTLTHPQQPHVVYRNSAWLSVRSRRSTHTQGDGHAPCGVTGQTGSVEM